MDLSIIIVNWNTSEYLIKCLNSIYLNAPSCGFEVILVDNASTDGSADAVNKFNKVKLIANPENFGYAKGNNQGILAATGEYVLLLNPDTEIMPNSLDSLLAFARSHPEAAAVSCKLIGPDGKIQSSCRSFPSPLPVLFEYTKLSRLFPRSRFFGAYRRTYFDYQHETEVDQPMASCLLLRRKSIEDIGLFDEAFPIYFNEVDWCYRAREKGWKIHFTPDAEIKHFGGASTRQIKPQMIAESHRALKVFYRKHYKRNLFTPLYWFVMAAISINSFFAVKLRSNRAG